MLINENALLDSTVTVFIKVVTDTVTDLLANNLGRCVIVILIKALISVTNCEIRRKRMVRLKELKIIERSTKMYGKDNSIKRNLKSQFQEMETCLRINSNKE